MKIPITAAHSVTYPRCSPVNTVTCSALVGGNSTTGAQQQTKDKMTEKEWTHTPRHAAPITSSTIQAQQQTKKKRREKEGEEAESMYDRIERGERHNKKNTTATEQSQSTINTYISGLEEGTAYNRSQSQIAVDSNSLL